MARLRSPNSPHLTQHLTQDMTPTSPSNLSSTRPECVGAGTGVSSGEAAMLFPVTVRIATVPLAQARRAAAEGQGGEKE